MAGEDRTSSRESAGPSTPSVLGGAWAIALKDLRHLLRDKAGAFFTLIFPLFVALLFGFMFGGSGGGGGDDALSVAVFNEDAGAGSRGFVKSLDDDASIKVVEVASMEAGETLVRKGEAIACLHLPKGFDPGDMFGGAGGNGGGLVIAGVVDPKRSAEAGLLTGKLNQITFMQLSDAFTNPSKMRGLMDRARGNLAKGDAPAPVRLALEGLFSSVDNVSTKVDEEKRKEAAVGGESAKSAGWMPVDVQLKELVIAKSGPPSAFALSFPQGIVWGLMGVVTGFAAAFAEERTRGTLLRLSVAPVSPATLLIGKALACFIACMGVQAMLVLLISLPWFNVRVTQPLHLLVVMVVTAASLTALAMMIAGLSKSSAGAAGLARGALIVLALIGGGSIPLMFMPPFMRTLSSVSPFKWSTMAMEGALWRGYSFAELALPLGVMGGMGVVCFAIGIVALSRANRA